MPGSPDLLRDLDLGVWRLPDSAFDQLWQTQRLRHGLIEPTAFGAVRDLIESLKLAEEQNRKALEPINNAIAAARADMADIARLSEVANRAIIDAYSPKLLDFQETINELMAPLRGAALDLQKQQEQIAEALNLDRWTEIVQTGQALQQHFRILAEAGRFAADPTVMAMVQELDAIEPKAEPTPEAIERLVAAIVGLVVTLAQNTKKRISEMDLIEIVVLIVTLKSALYPDYTSADRVRDQKTAQVVERMEQAAKQAATARAAEHNYLSSLPRAIVSGLGRIRESPTVSSHTRNGLSRGAVVAITEKRGRWRHVIFHDEITGDLANGWLWGGSLTEFDK